MAYTTIDDPTQFFNTIIWSGDSSSPENLTVGFQPDWIWGKLRNTGYSHQLYDSVRGFGNDKDLQLGTSGNPAEGAGTADQYGYISGTTSTGFTATKGSDGGADGYGYWNESGRTYVAWNWLAGGSASSNSNGSVTSSVSANTTAGFSIVKYTGAGTGTTTTIGHGLGAVPDMYIVKSLDSIGNWQTYHHKMSSDPKTDYIQLDTQEAVTDFTFWGDTAPTSTVFTVKDGNDVNESGEEYIAYCFKSIKGYSKFGKYEGNGNANGTFVYTGFRPAFVITKRTDSTTGSYWVIYDNKRDTFNPLDRYLYAYSNTSENTGTNLDFLSNGFKPTVSNVIHNASGGTYIYMAFAENPFVNSNKIPVNAR